MTFCSKSNGASQFPTLYLIQRIIHRGDMVILSIFVLLWQVGRTQCQGSMAGPHSNDEH